MIRFPPEAYTHTHTQTRNYLDSICSSSSWFGGAIIVIIIIIAASEWGGPQSTFLPFGSCARTHVRTRRGGPSDVVNLSSLHLCQCATITIQKDDQRREKGLRVIIIWLHLISCSRSRRLLLFYLKFFSFSFNNDRRLLGSGVIIIISQDDDDGTQFIL